MEVDLHDELEFTSASGFKLTVEGADVPVDDSNLISKIYQFIWSIWESEKREIALPAEAICLLICLVDNVSILK